MKNSKERIEALVISTGEEYSMIERNRNHSKCWFSNCIILRSLGGKNKCNNPEYIKYLERKVEILLEKTPLSTYSSGTISSRIYLMNNETYTKHKEEQQIIMEKYEEDEEFAENTGNCYNFDQRGMQRQRSYMGKKFMTAEEVQEEEILGYKEEIMARVNRGLQDPLVIETIKKIDPFFALDDEREDMLVLQVLLYIITPNVRVYIGQ